MTFLLFFSHKSYTNFLPHFFIYFFINFYIKLYMIFPKGTVGVFIAKMKEWEASFGVPRYTSASRPFKGMTSIGVPWYTNASSFSPALLAPRQHFFFCVCLFLISGLIFVQLFGGIFQALFSSNFICMESYRCLVSNGSSLVWFGAMVIEILSSK